MTVEETTVNHVGTAEIVSRTLCRSNCIIGSEVWR
jgi:hypothetical protein